MLEEILKKALPDITTLQLGQFRTYYALLIDWNTRMNLTRIVDEDEVARKHFLDSLSPLLKNLIPQGVTLIDVGTGAGFPGIPLLIMRPDIRLTLLDSLQKRLAFLQEVLMQLHLKADIVHTRAEDGARLPSLREKFDIAAARALAPLPVLLEYLLPFVKKGGHALCYKGPSVADELSQSTRALTLLGGSRIDEFCHVVPDADSDHRLLWIEKTTSTPKDYPRKAGIAERKPLI